MKIIEALNGNLYHYEVIGEHEEEAAAELEKTIAFYQRDFYSPSDYIMEDIAKKRRELEARYNVTIKAV